VFLFLFCMQFFAVLNFYTVWNIFGVY